ncbi:carbohydrate ABC transporter permease [Cryptosporangium aurantiacum]|uniref:Carbohydrate ABC transporter membrane protein 1, CUT1 family n=1 Tax=Cryptosporangium aurantiacum TaxID=134849 RepID=A0A1M7R1B6_9ACTN|nr:sugar ABC transporter permease [Cryptosporangium aurantiacum]SHN38601.1 carbohydrate ABC transporter membrane protein 1, CUT1 family [Cryptosporangium aurantiacum]
MVSPPRTADRVAPPAAPAPPAVPRRRRRGIATPYLFLLVPLAFLVVFTYVPVVNIVWYSLTSWDGLAPSKTFVGVDNYVEIATRPDLLVVFRTSLYYLGASAVQIVLALYFATVLSFNVRFRNVFKGIIFFPYLINGVAIAMIFLFFFQPGGTLDSTLQALGLEGLSRQWLGDSGTVNYSLAGTSVWRFLGLNFVLFLGAIQSIPGQLYEAAELDGANRWHQFRHLILPGIRPVVGLSVILAISGSLSVFEIPYIMTAGANESATFVIQTVEFAFKFRKYGLASAMAVVLLALILLVTWVQRRIIPDEKADLT